MKIIKLIPYYAEIATLKLINVLYQKDIISDKLFLTLLFRVKMGRWINWRHPKTLNEKIQWIKLYDRKKEYTRIVDKLEFKNWIEEKIGKGYTVPVLAVWDGFDDIDLNTLPEKFVIKPNHGSGGTYIHTGNEKADIGKIRELVGYWFDLNHFKTGCEWAYKDVRKKLFAEELLEYANPFGGVPDYKFFCFNGVPTYVQVFSYQAEHYNFDVQPRLNYFQAFYDMDWQLQELRQGVPHKNHIEVDLPKPENFEKMKELAAKLTQGMPFARADFYNIDGRVYAGELTFYPYTGMHKLEPEGWDEKLGQMVDLF